MDWRLSEFALIGFHENKTLHAGTYSELLPGGVALVVLEGAVQAAKGKKCSVVLPSHRASKPQQWLVV